jgi:hypothetical protein
MECESEVVNRRFFTFDGEPKVGASVRLMFNLHTRNVYLCLNCDFFDCVNTVINRILTMPDCFANFALKFLYFSQTISF